MTSLYISNQHVNNYHNVSGYRLPFVAYFTYCPISCAATANTSALGEVAMVRESILFQNIIGNAQ